MQSTKWRGKVRCAFAKQNYLNATIKGQSTITKNLKNIFSDEELN